MCIARRAAAECESQRESQRKRGDRKVGGFLPSIWIIVVLSLSLTRSAHKRDNSSRRRQPPSLSLPSSANILGSTMKQMLVLLLLVSVLCVAYAQEAEVRGRIDQRE